VQTSAALKRSVELSKGLTFIFPFGVGLGIMMAMRCADVEELERKAASDFQAEKQIPIRLP